MIHKIFSFIAFLSIYLASYKPALAQSINPCPRGGGGQFGTLCTFDADTLGNIVRNGITILFIIATLAALFFLVAGGIKWITSGGDKANLETARNWIVAAAVGLIITFASYFILNIILELFGLPSVRTYTIPNLVN